MIHTVYLKDVRRYVAGEVAEYFSRIHPTQPLGADYEAYLHDTVNKVWMYLKAAHPSTSGSWTDLQCVIATDARRVFLPHDPSGNFHVRFCL